MSTIEVRNLHKRYGATVAVDDVSFTVEAGEIFGILGPNGAGKTTTLRMLMGFTPPSAGSIEVLGMPVPAQARQMRQRAGVVPQFDNLDPDFTVLENLQTYASYFGLRGRWLEQRLQALLEFAQLTERAAAPIQALSGGMKRRLTLARALVNDPALLVLDEPTTGLDPQARQHIWERMHRLINEGRTLILTTHYMEEAERLCDRAAIMEAGRVVACDSPAALIRTHIEPNVAELRGHAANQWLAQPRDTDGVRIEHVGETVLIYGHEGERVRQVAAAAVGERYLFRPANLEDVFLKLTGRALRD